MINDIMDKREVMNRRIIFLLPVLVIIMTCIIFINWSFFKKKKKDQPITLKVMWWGGQTRHDKTLKVIDIFEEQNPLIKIEPIYTSWDGYWDKLTPLVAANEMPDVVQMTIQNMPQFAEKNLLADLSMIKSIDLSDMDKVFKELGSLDGKFLGITLGANAPCLIYNKDIFDKAGVSYPDDKWTWDDLEKKANQIYLKLGITGVNSIIRDYNDFEVFAREKGETIYSKNNRVGFTQKTLADFLALGQRMIRSGGMESMKVTMEFRSNEENTPYAHGRSAMMFLWSNKIVGVKKTLGKDSEIIVYPGPDSFNKGMYIKPGLFFCIARSSKYWEQAGKFVNFFVNDINANLVLDAERGIPVFPNVRKALSENADSQNKKIFEFMDKLGKLADNPMDRNFPVEDREVKVIMRNIMEEVGLDRISPIEGAKKIIDEWNKVFLK